MLLHYPNIETLSILLSIHYTNVALTLALNCTPKVTQLHNEIKTKSDRLRCLLGLSLMDDACGHGEFVLSLFYIDAREKKNVVK